MKSTRLDWIYGALFGLGVIIVLAALLVAVAGCQEATVAPQLTLTQEAPVDCDMDLAQAKAFLEAEGLLEYLLSQEPPPTDDDIIEAAVLVCTGGITRPRS